MTSIGIPFAFGFSGFHSKDVIVEQAINYGATHVRLGSALLGNRRPLM